MRPGEAEEEIKFPGRPAPGSRVLVLGKANAGVKQRMVTTVVPSQG